ncbi:MAG: hypothetical protein GTN38_01590 [Candidatus Aenigmarchaeota archaeon]|nr:hypothetical protein [Candidatus Aenigmarchaeota archaeon]NIQ17272.1 hypothetical protein [Candidatus Aenigmarchaeota archaeon]NIS73133.1 hypothetical protein [Candidatus Aenigmarchaeota archaeon]
MKRAIIYLGDFDPFSPYNMATTLQKGKEYDVKRFIIAPFYQEPQDFDRKSEIIHAWMGELPLKKVWLESILSGEVFRNFLDDNPYLMESPKFEIAVSDVIRQPSSLSGKIVEIMNSEGKWDYYVMTDSDTCTDFSSFNAHKKMYKKFKLLVSRCDNGPLFWSEDPVYKNTGEYGWITVPKRTIEGDLGLIRLPESRGLIKLPESKGELKLKFELNESPVSELYSTELIEHSEKYANMYPREVKKLIEKHYVK